MNSTASPEEQDELRQLFSDPQLESEVKKLIFESLKEETPVSLSEHKTDKILKMIFEDSSRTAYPGIELQRKSLRKRYWKPALAVMLLLVSVSVLMLWNGQEKNELDVSPVVIPAQETPVSPKVEKDIVAGTDKALLILDDGEQIELEKEGQGSLAKRLGLEVKNDGKHLVYDAEGETDIAKVQYNTIIVPRKGKYSLTLSDGTKVWMNAESTLRYPVQFTGNDRVVELKGEAYFEVAKHAGKSFHVIADGTDVEALGTKFNVMSYSNEAVQLTTLLEGSIRVKKEGHSVMVTPGKQAEWKKQSGTLLERKADIESTMAWKDGFFIFNDRTPLTSVMRQLERWYDIEVHYAGTVPKEKFGGGLQRSLPLSSVVTLLKESGIKLTLKGNSLTIH